MTDFTKSLNSGGRGFTLRLRITLDHQDIAANQSYLDWSLTLIKGTDSYSYGTKYWNAKVGTTSSGSRAGYDFRSYSSLTLGSGTKVITHNDDGTKSLSVSGTFDDSDYPTFGSGTASGTYTLPTIPRGTQPTVSPVSGNTADTFTIDHTPASSAFYHDVAYSVDGGSTWTDIVTDLAGTDTSTDWTPAHTLFPDSESGTATIRVITYDSLGGTVIGTKTVDLPLSVPTSVKPTVSSVTWEDTQVVAPDIPTMMGGAGRYVQGWSKLKPTVTAAGSGGSTITGSQVTQNGQVTASGTAFAAAVGLSGAVPFSAVATDSRARSSDAFVDTVTVKAYNFPNLPVPLVSRTSDGAGAVPDPAGTYLAITPAASVSDLTFGGVQKNDLEYRIRIKTGAGAYTTVQDWVSASGITWTTKQVFSGYSASSEHTVEVSIRDVFGKNGYNTASTVKVQAVSVPSESVLIDFDGADGLGLGKYRSSGFLDVGGDINADGSIYQDGNKVLDESDRSSLGQLLVGAIYPWAGSTEPSWGKFLNGQTLTVAGYSALAAIYPSWVSGSDLVLPDWRGRVPVGYKSGDTDFGILGSFVGSKTHTHPLSDAGQAQVEIASVSSNAVKMRRVALSGGGSFTPTHQTSNANGTAGGAAASNGAALTGATDAGSDIQPSVVVNWVVCVVSSVGDYDPVVQSALVSDVADLQNGYRRMGAPLVFTSSGTFTTATYIAMGARACRFIVQGGGGSGGGAVNTSSGNHSDGGGGGAGGWAEGFFLLADLPSSVTLTVGAGGTGGTGAGNDGGTSSVDALVVATGGKGGDVGGNTGLAIGYKGGDGGIGTAGDVLGGGQPGGMAGGYATLPRSGVGGSSRFGSGGASRYTGSSGGRALGIDGTGYGAGGSGAGMAQSASPATAGGSGSGGVIYVELFA